MQNKKFLFLIAPYLAKEQLSITDNNANRVEMSPPYGPLSIISYINANSKQDVDFKIIDLKMMSNDEINRLSEKIKEYNPDYIAISALFSLCYKHLGWIEKAIVDSETNAVTIIGGALATGSYEEVFKNFPRIQVVAYGEGEIPCNAIVMANDPTKSYESNSAVVTRESLEAGIQPKSQYIQNLDEIPPFDFSYIDLDKYTGIQYADGRQTDKSIEIVTSRGCPYDCIFCSCHLMYGKKIRFHSAERVCGEIDRYIEMGFKTIRFYDENFFFNKDRAKLILEHIISYNDPDISIEFPSGMMTARIDEEIAELLKKGGLKSASLAVESGSEYVLKEIIKKPVRRQDVIRAVNALKKYDIKIKLYIVVGFPGETDEHRKQTVDFIKTLGVDWAQILVATPFKGSRLYDLCIENNYLYNYDSFNISLRKCYIKTPEYSPEYIEFIAYKMNLEINFVQNYNLINNNFEKALSSFLEVIGLFPKHAFGHYCCAQCYKNLGQPEKSEHHLKIFNTILNEDPFWKKYANEFSLKGKSYTDAK